MRGLMLVLLAMSLSACLKTRAELRGEPSYAREERSTQGVNQQQRAQMDSRFSEIDQDFRQLYGKIESLEKQLSDLQSAPAQATGGSELSGEQMKKLEKRLSTLEEALLSLDKKVSRLGDKSSAIDPSKIKGPFARGEAFFAKGQYEKAIESFDEYRRNFPKGDKYPDATLKMGLAFQKLKMNQDAKAFYQEVIQRYPKSATASKAQENLKSI